MIVFLYVCTLANKSRSARRSKAAEPHDPTNRSSSQYHVTIEKVPGAPLSTRLKYLLSPAICSQPPNIKPRPPSMPKVREHRSLIPCIPSASVSVTNQTATITKEYIPIKKKDTHRTVQTASGMTDTHTLSQRHPSQEHTSQTSRTKDQTHAPSFKSSSDRRSPLRKAQSVTPSPISTRMHRDHEKKQSMTRNEAARIIQRAWRR